MADNAQDTHNMNTQNEGTVNPVQVQKYLADMEYPADKNAIIEKAREEGADENVMQTLEKIPEQEFQTPADVSQAIGQAK